MGKPESPEILTTTTSQQLGLRERLLTYIATPLSYMLPDTWLKRLTGQAIKSALPPQTLSSELMTRCIDQNLQTFGRTDLEALNPSMPSEMRDRILASLRHSKIDPSTIAPGTTRLISLSDSHSHLTDDLLGGSRNIGRDVGRAVGNATLKRNADGSFTLIDYFDFKNLGALPDMVPANDPRSVKNETSANLLRAAMRWHELGHDEGAQVTLGRMFCPEPSNNMRGSQSVPIAITFTESEILNSVSTPRKFHELNKQR
jgi:hypothetical protein